MGTGQTEYSNMEDVSVEEKGAEVWACAPSAIRDGKRRAAGSGGRLRAGEGGGH